MTDYSHDGCKCEICSPTPVTSTEHEILNTVLNELAATRREVQNLQSDMRNLLDTVNGFAGLAESFGDNPMLKTMVKMLTKKG